jgi:hypothetical protein
MCVCPPLQRQFQVRARGYLLVKLEYVAYIANTAQLVSAPNEPFVIHRLCATFTTELKHGNVDTLCHVLTYRHGFDDA